LSGCHDLQTTVVSAGAVQPVVVSLESSQPQQLWGQTWSPAYPQLPHWLSSAGEGVPVIPWPAAVVEPSVAVVSVAVVAVAAVVVSTAAAVETVESVVVASCFPAAGADSSSASLVQLLSFQETWVQVWADLQDLSYLTAYFVEQPWCWLVVP